MDLLDLTLAAVPDEFGMDSYLTEDQTASTGPGLTSHTTASTFGDTLSASYGISTAGSTTVSGFYSDNLNTSTVSPSVNGNQYTSDPFGYYSSNTCSQGSPQVKQEQVKTEPSNSHSEESNIQVPHSTGEIPENKNSVEENKDSILQETDIKSEISEEKQVKVRAVDPKAEPELTPPEDEGKMISVVINNVVGNFSTRCHINLKRLALEGVNVIYKRENGMVQMKLRNPSTTASIWSSGKITCTGSKSELEAKQAARKVARILQKLGFRIRFSSFRVVNVLGTCSLPFGIKIAAFSRVHPRQASYEPELHPGVTFTIKPPKKATLKIFSTGSVTVTAPSVANVKDAIEHIFPLVYEHRMDKISKKPQIIQLPPKLERDTCHRKAQYGRHYIHKQSEEDAYHDSDIDDIDDIESDESLD